MRHAASQPTDVELALLRVLWERGPSTVRQVQEALAREKAVGYTTVLKMLQTMFEKGLVARDETERSHVYVAAQDQRATQKGLLRDLLDKAFSGSARDLVMLALQEAPLPSQEKAAVRALLEAKRKERRP